jgi:RNA-directed DNA polymerase
MDKRMLQQWLGAGYWEKGRLFPTREGTPQGGIISPLLANLTLDGMEKAIRSRIRIRRDQVNFIRYADDFIVTARTKETLEQIVKPAVVAFLAERGLELSEQKTVITHIHKGFNFLGHTVRKFGNKLLTFPAKGNLKALREKISLCVKSARGLSQEALLRKLNPLLRGWASYHRHGSSQQTFATGDHALCLALWPWAKRRHPHKSRHWSKAAYFQVSAGRRWVFGGQRPAKAGRPQRVRLCSASSVALKRHPQIKGAANPFDPVWEGYCEYRLGVTIADALKGRRQLLPRWQEQHGCCPVCQQPITSRTGWENHHLIWRTNGGTDQAANRVLLHPTCHRQVHSQGLTVAKPHPSRDV